MDIVYHLAQFLVPEKTDKKDDSSIKILRSKDTGKLFKTVKNLYNANGFIPDAQIFFNKGDMDIWYKFVYTNIDRIDTLTYSLEDLPKIEKIPDSNHLEKLMLADMIMDIKK